MSEWIVYRTATRTLVYTGIEADTRDEALEAFMRGAGEVQVDREQNSEWKLDAVPLTAASSGDTETAT